MHNLLSKIKIGQHTMLQKAWKKQTALHEVGSLIGPLPTVINHCSVA